MSCKACGSDGGLEVCLNCGHTFCAMHRSETGGAPTCTPCLKEESERTRARKAKKVEQQAVGTPIGDPVEVTAKPIPLPEPKSRVKPILWGLATAAPTAGYLWWLGGTLVLDNAWPGWSQPALCGVGSLFAFAGVWAIVKSK